MCYSSKKLLAGVLISTVLCSQGYAKKTCDISSIVEDVADKEKTVELVCSDVNKARAVETTHPCENQIIAPSTPVATKERVAVKNGDYVFSTGGKMKIEHFFDKNADLLNHSIPDTLEYFKHCVDLNFDYAFGKEKFGYNAAEAFVELRHKGVWGKAMSASDKDAGGPGAPSIVVMDNVSLGGHTHDTGRTLAWVKEAWLQISPNAILNSTSVNYLHFLKIGWVPFELGRGIALGGVYGAGKDLFGLYSYGEDKATPGILLHGQLIKDKLSYDLYYSKFEERGKSFSGNIAPIRRHD
ncbi:MAG: hypothetical protein WCT20_02145, partial [Candidatus Babeliales bacterium]